MCGITGLVNFTRGRSHADLMGSICAMTETLRHRGPDDLRVFVREDLGLALGHTRLAIRDVSPTGRQPMVSSCGRYVIVYNGEIYSQSEVAAHLGQRRRSLRGTSDTEIILESCAEYGVAQTVARLNGMYAFALIDLETGEVSLVRDRLGIKPLYWRVYDGTLSFGSELKALRASGDAGWAIDRDAIAGYLRYSYVAGPRTAFHNVRKLEPGTVVTFDRNGNPREFRYWSPEDFVVAADLSPAAVLEELDALLSDAVARCLVSDVPIGTLLSGGIDSSLVSALMVETSSRQVNTFTIGFDDPRFNEAPIAREISHHLGTSHHELTASADSVIRLVTEIPKYFDEPFADSSQLPMMLVAELTRKEVSVVLSGDGGDECFGGYPRYAATQKLSRAAARLPSSLADLFGTILESAPLGLLDHAALALVPPRFRRAQMGNRLRELGQAIKTDSIEPLYRGMLSHWRHPGELITGTTEPHRGRLVSSLHADATSALNEMRLEDLSHYLPDDILTKVDRATMRVGLEARVPLLDHRVVEFALSLSGNSLVHNDSPKWPLRELLYRRVPRELVDRPKMGFGVPLDDWLRGPLRGWAADLLSVRALQETDLLQVRPVREIWTNHLRGRNAGYLLWDIIVLQAWLLYGTE